MTDILALLIAERERLNRAIEALEGGAGGRSGRIAGGARKRGGRRGMSAEARRAQSERMKRYWAKRRKEKARKP